MSAPGTTDITYKLYGLEHMGGRVLADIFAKKLQVLIKGLRDIDKSRNGGTRFDYVIVGMQMSSAIVALHEKQVSEKSFKKRPAVELVEYGRQIALGAATMSDSLEPVISTYEKLTKNTTSKFSYATLSGGDEDNVVRIDAFLERSINRIVNKHKAEVALRAPEHFEGHAWGAFDGEVKEVDFRGDLPEGHLILSAGNQDIPCVLYLPEDQIKKILNQRVSVEGEAIYDGTSGLPVRIEIRSVKKIEGQSLLRWAGTFDEMISPIWGDSEA